MPRDSRWKAVGGWVAGGLLFLGIVSVSVYTLASYDVNKAFRVHHLESTFVFSHLGLKPGLQPVLVFQSRDHGSRAEWSLWPFRQILIRVTKGRPEQSRVM